MFNPDDGADATNLSRPVCAVEMESLNDVKCEDVDLLSVSCKLAHFSTDVVESLRSKMLSRESLNAIKTTTKFTSC